MATTIPTPAQSSFWSTLKSWLPAIELAGNVALLATGLGAPFEPLIAGLENAVNPLLTSIGTPQSTPNLLLSIYATIIGVLTILKQTTGLPPAIMAEIEGYIAAAQNGTAAFVQAQAGFNPALYSPVTPIA